MPLGLEKRISALEKHSCIDEDGRDPGMVELYEIICSSEGVPFYRELVPVGYTVRELMAKIDGRSRGKLPRECELAKKR
jgi:hypothetical protein